jgi:molybdopterin converting factor subunit 1
MMQCTVLLFAQLADAAGTRRVDLVLPEHATAGDGAAAIFTRFPSLAPWRDRIAIAVDERYAAAAARLRDGSVIALIPPVSGG